MPLLFTSPFSSCGLGLGSTRCEVNGRCVGRSCQAFNVCRISCCDVQPQSTILPLYQKVWCIPSTSSILPPPRLGLHQRDCSGGMSTSTSARVPVPRTPSIGSLVQRLADFIRHVPISQVSISYVNPCYPPVPDRS